MWKNVVVHVEQSLNQCSEGNDSVKLSSQQPTVGRGSPVGHCPVFAHLNAGRECEIFMSIALNPNQMINKWHSRVNLTSSHVFENGYQFTNEIGYKFIITQRVGYQFAATISQLVWLLRWQIALCYSVLYYNKSFSLRQFFDKSFMSNIVAVKLFSVVSSLFIRHKTNTAY